MASVYSQAQKTPPPPSPDDPDGSSASSSSHALDAAFEAMTHSSSSSHALDVNLDMGPDDLNEDNTSDNRIYIDFDGQLVYKKSDSGKERSLKKTIFNILRGRAMPLKPLLVSITWAVIAVVISWVTSKGYEPNEKGECRWWCSPLAIDGDALSYVGFALFLLTSFRVQEAYSRYMDGVRIWTNIGGTVTSFAKYVCQAFDGERIHRGDRERMLGFLVAFPITLKRELRNERDLRELKGVLAQEDLAKIQAAPSMPSYCLYVLSSYCLSAKKTESELPQTFLVHLIRWIADLAGSADSCNQLKTMPSPASYISHLNTFLALWLFFLPFAIVETTGWATILIVAFISYGILGVVANAAELENPFGCDYNDLPLGRLARSIQEAVAATYLNSKKDQNRFVRAVADQELKKSDDYWLNPEKEKKDK